MPSECCGKRLESAASCTSLGIKHLSALDIKTTEVYLRASPAEKLEILEANAPPSIRPGTFSGIKDDLMRILGGGRCRELMPSECVENPHG